MKKLIKKFDLAIINWLQTLEVPLARIAIFTVYVWFGSLKLFGVSPAAPLVQSLFERTIHFMPFSVFYALFSLFEVIIGLLFLIRGMERTAIFLLGLHLITTVMPLVFLPEITWQAFLAPTLEGQYIIKNILIAASAVVVGSRVVAYGARNKT
ncbi:MAG: hypothetical protein Q8R30_05430 [bacterium]|nr:hypothetical protein [bacterium]